MDRFAVSANYVFQETTGTLALLPDPGKTQNQERALIDAAVAWLRERLPSGWQIERAGGDADAQIAIRSPQSHTTIVVEAKRSVAPRDVAAWTSGLARSLRTVVPNVPVLVVAPWLSARARELLAEAGLNYLDTTGNALLRLDDPAVFISAAGADRNPQPPERPVASLRGPKAARLIRTLADVRPPYGVSELASAAGLTAGYVSRLLERLDREAIVERGPRGAVLDVDVGALLRAWAESYDVFRRELTTTWLAPGGPRSALGSLAEAPGRTAVTGSFAAVRLAPVAAPSLLVAYCEHVEETADALGLLPADTAPNVVLLRPFDEVVWTRTQDEDGVAYAASSQVVVDCLTGDGRMPAEGEALLTALVGDDRWRAPNLAAGIS